MTFRNLTTSAILIALFSSTPAFAKKVYIQASPNTDQRTLYRDGNQAMISEKDFVVAVESVSSRVATGKTSTKFLVSMMNTSSKPINFSVDNVRLYAGSKTLKVWQPGELERKERRRAAILAALAGLSAATNSMSTSLAANNPHSSAGSATTYRGPNYSSTQNTIAQQNIQTNLNLQLANINKNASAALNHISSNALNLNTVEPGAWYGGVVNVKTTRKTKRADEIILEVEVRGETHQFHFDLTS